MSLVLMVGVATAGRAQEWSQWRGENRDGVAVGARLPATWPERLPLKWRCSVGEGYSTPVVAGGRVFFMERHGGDEVVRALDADTGRPVWRHAYPVDYEVHQYAGRHGNWPKATSTVTGGRVFSHGISGIVSALRVQDGAVLWQRDLGAEFSSAPMFGASASPLVESGLVILPVGDADGGGGIMAFRATDGKIVWRSVRDGPSYSSPIAADLAGVRQVVSFTANQLVGVGLESGKRLWAYPFKLPWNETITTPLVWNGNVVFAGRDRGGTRVLQLRRDGKDVKTEEVWRKKAPVYMSSPVIRGDAYFAVEHRTGRLFCLHLADGALAWKHGTFGDYASLVLAGDRLLILDSGGRLTVIEATSEAYREVATLRVSDSKTYAHLVVVGSRLYVRDAQQVMCFDLSAQSN
jgi:outer membrane protein assembly factor BamB